MSWLQGFDCRREITAPSDGLAKIDIWFTKTHIRFTLADGITEIKPVRWDEDENCFWIKLLPNEPIYMYYTK